MKIALAQIDTLVGDLEGNCARVRETAAKAGAQGADLVVFPELTITGYDPRDLLRMPAFLEASERALADLAAPAEWNRDVALVVGFAEVNKSRDGAPAFNACALIQGGEVRAVARKCLLPSYDVLEEPRYFEASPEVTVVPFGGINLGLSICEDIWSSPRFHPRRRHRRDPVSELTAGGADLIVNLSASPFQKGKPAFRQQMLSSLAAEHGVQVVMTNAVGGNDGTIFDGTSLAMAADGQTVVRCLSFREDLRIFDTSAASSPTATATPGRSADLDEIHDALVLGIRDYCRKTGFRSVVLGLSGGIDSALVAALAAEALGPDRVLAVAMPSRYSSAGSLMDARLLAKNLAIELREISIEGPFSAFLDALGPHLSPAAAAAADLTQENIQPRVRSTYLMALSNALGHLLLACGNKSELAVGYCTLYGDMAGGLAPIGDVLKTTAYSLATRINERAGRDLIPAAIIEKAPSAELAPGQLDQDSLPPYPVLDGIVAAFVEEGLDLESIVKLGHDPETTERMIRLILRSEHKRRQAAPVIMISRAPFGSGYRLPIAGRPRI